MATALTEHQLAVALTATALVIIAAAVVFQTRRAPTDAPQTAKDCCPGTTSTATTPASPEHTTR